MKTTETVGPVLIHIITQKGKGYAPAETASDKMHGVGPYNPKDGKSISKPSSKPKVLAAAATAAAVFTVHDTSSVHGFASAVLHKHACVSQSDTRALGTESFMGMCCQWLTPDGVIQQAPVPSGCLLRRLLGHSRTTTALAHAASF